ncbi:Fic family protein [Terrisporobacter sp.]|uniref:Fic family protein n=1 Tax=Terrisporobacter sp. TaxID=1965305 RepID=UPI0026166623|nr:Fic family protein [Terrisporobacter sp.]
MDYKLLSHLYYKSKTLYEETYISRYESESTYRFNFKIKGNNAFVVINNDLVQKLDKILELDKELLIIMNSVPPIALKQYQRTCLVDEIRMTNEIEGVNSTRKEINDILNDKNNKDIHKRLYGIVKKYEMLLNDEDIDLLNCKSIRKLYDDLTLIDIIKDNPEHEPDGDIFRKDKVYIYNKYQKEIHTGVMPESEIIESMSNALDMLHCNDYNFLIRIAVFHYMFGYIHPFYDGNGRTSRFISSYLLSKRLVSLVSYRIAYTIKENINTYYKSFELTNDEKNKGDMTYFVLVFFDFIIKSIEELYQSLLDKYNRLEHYEEIINKQFSDNDKLCTITYLLVQSTLFNDDDSLGIKDIHYYTNISISSVRSIIRLLKEYDLLSISKVGNRLTYDVNLDKLDSYNE